MTDDSANDRGHSNGEELRPSGRTSLARGMNEAGIGTGRRQQPGDIIDRMAVR